MPILSSCLRVKVWTLTFPRRRTPSPSANPPSSFAIKRPKYIDRCHRFSSIFLSVCTVIRIVQKNMSSKVFIYKQRARQKSANPTSKSDPREQIPRVLPISAVKQQSMPSTPGDHGAGPPANICFHSEAYDICACDAIPYFASTHNSSSNSTGEK